MTNIKILKEYIKLFVYSDQINHPNKIPYGANREEITSLGSKDDDSEEISDHLIIDDENEFQEDEDVFGPVPPTGPKHYVTNDPFTRDYFVLPTKPIYR